MRAYSYILDCKILGVDFAIGHHFLGFVEIENILAARRIFDMAAREINKRICIYVYIYFSACQYRDPNIYPSRSTLDRYYVNINQNSWHCGIAKLFILSPPPYNVFGGSGYRSARYPGLHCGSRFLCD
jgi:hypothetical protein